MKLNINTHQVTFLLYQLLIVLNLFIVYRFRQRGSFWLFFISPGQWIKNKQLFKVGLIPWKRQNELCKHFVEGHPSSIKFTLDLASHILHSLLGSMFTVSVDKQPQEHLYPSKLKVIFFLWSLILLLYSYSDSLVSWFQNRLYWLVKTSISC